MENKPLKITVEHWDTKISIEKDHSDVAIQELHEMWISMVRALGFSYKSIKEIYDE
jgi:hypothetical protein